jgi:Ran-binding protein 9/10
MSQAGPPRRSSYASVLSGVPQPLPNPSSRTLPHPGGHADGHHAEGMPSSSWSKHAGLPPYSPFPHIDPSVPSFFIPSYLRGSRHAERLEEAHKVKGSAQKEGRSAHSSNAGSLSTSSSSVNLQKMVPSHRGMTHEVVERTPATSADPLVAPLPSRWSEQDKFNGLEILNDGLDVRFGAPNRTTHEEAAALRADHPMPKQCGIYYFEVTVLSKGKEG